MPYFIILPAYVILLLLLGIAVVTTRMIPQLRWTSGYLVSGMVGTLPAFLLANVIITLAGILPLWLTRQFEPPEWFQQVCSMVSIIALMIGPFVASTVGILLGFASGCLILRWRRVRKPPSL